jgi:hypothetical protein
MVPRARVLDRPQRPGAPQIVFVFPIMGTPIPSIDNVPQLRVYGHTKS